MAHIENPEDNPLEVVAPAPRPQRQQQEHSSAAAAAAALKGPPSTGTKDYHQDSHPTLATVAMSTFSSGGGDGGSGGGSRPHRPLPELPPGRKAFSTGGPPGGPGQMTEGRPSAAADPRGFASTGEVLRPAGDKG